MLPNPHGLERLVAERREALLREAERERLVRELLPPPAPRHLWRVRVAEVLRQLADRVEPSAASVCS